MLDKRITHVFVSEFGIGKVVNCIVFVRNTQATSKLYSSTDESNIDAILIAQIVNY